MNPPRLKPGAEMNPRASKASAAVTPRPLKSGAHFAVLALALAAATPALATPMPTPSGQTAAPAVRSAASPIAPAAADWDATWRAYRRQFVSADGRVIDPIGHITTSEGQAYALFFALVADDRACFERLLVWTRDNLAGGDLARALPAWKWGRKPGGEWGVIDPNSASDADLWLAYVLIEAARVWRIPAYRQLGRALLDRIAQEEVAHLPGGPVLLLGRDGGESGPGRYLLNPSYSALFQYVRFAEVDPDGPWRKLAAALPDFLNNTSPKGYAPDWITFDAAENRYLWQPRGRTGSYDAIRVYLWAGLTHPATPGARPVLMAISGMARAFVADGRVPREVDAASGVRTGDAPPGFLAAFLPYLERLGRSPQPLGVRLAASRRSDGLYGADAAYYDQNLALFGLGPQTGRFRFDARGHLLRGLSR